jgi:endonuclease YncB( thermonuclease family)
MRWLSTLVLLLFATLALADITGTARVIDGDTLDIEGQRIRLHGIDAPESRQTCLVGHEVWLCGQEATRALESFIGGSPVTCQEQDVDRYGRTIATCRVRGARKEIEDMVRGKRIYIMTARRMISGEVLKYRNEFLIHGRYETRFTNSSEFCLTMPRYPNGVRTRISGVKGQRPC